ncbi:MAG: prepilin peptidase [Candidatus Woesearchaeota archaeon]
MLLISLIITLIFLIIASIIDIKTREVPDYLSFGLIFIAFAIALAYTIIYKEYFYLINTLLGFVLSLIIAYIMFYLGQWGGGDSKLIMGLGAIIGFNVFPIFGETNLWFLVLIISIIFFGAAYGLMWSITLAIRKRKIFLENLKLWVNRRGIIITRRILLVIIVLLTIAILTIIPKDYTFIMLFFVSVIYLLFYLWLFVKVIEETCMIKEVTINKLTEGDWIYKDVYIGKKFITGPKDLGVSREQIVLLKKYSAKGKIKTVIIKEGIPFIPAFLLAYVATIVVYYINIF